MKSGVHALMVLFLSTALANPQDPAGTPNSSLETIEVEGTRAELRKEITAYVSALTRLDGELVSRWNKYSPVCPFVAADSPQVGEFIKGRLLEIAAQVPIPIESDPGCRANLFVIVSAKTPDYVAKWESAASWEKLDDGRSRWKPRAGATRSMESLPVRTWHNMRIEASNGGPMLAFGTNLPGVEVPRVKDLGSRITSNVSENLNGVVVLVDTKAAAGVTVSQLADYIAMTSFAKPDLEADLGKLDSILQLFAVEPAQRPSGLTEWDQAFLRGLYRINYAPKNQRPSIAARMVNDLAPR